jgi:aspartyl-tRNA(Asn)/glutamyl-tRNA(Gln) amidotransferase subunit B
MKSDYEINIGLEIHAELKTKTKIFCSCKNSFGDAPNTNVCPVCVGFPGTLPAVNKQAAILAIRAGLALGSRISPHLVFDRKHYYYPDLPKAYQISQDKLPLCVGGGIKLSITFILKRTQANSFMTHSLTKHSLTITEVAFHLLNM